MCAMDSPQSEEARWFPEEVLPHQTQLKAYLRSSFCAVRDVDDVVQESYLRIWRVRAGKPIRSAKAFLFQVARNLAIDAVRKTRATPIDPLRDLSTLTVLEDSPTAADAFCYQERVSLVAAALTQLPHRCREVIILRKFRHVSQRNIAAELGISERTVESHVTRGMKLMEAYLRRRGITGFFRDEK